MFNLINTDVRYTNYVRLNGYLQTNENNAGAEPSNCDGTNTASSTTPLHPSNDPEREGEIRYQRLPKRGRKDGPARTHVVFYYFLASMLIVNSY